MVMAVSCAKVGDESLCKLILLVSARKRKTKPSTFSNHSLCRYQKLQSLLEVVLVLEIMRCVGVRIVPISCFFGQMPEYL